MAEEIFPPGEAGEKSGGHGDVPPPDVEIDDEAIRSLVAEINPDLAEAIDKALDPQEYTSRIFQPVADPSMRDTMANVEPPNVNEEVAVMRTCDGALTKLPWRTRRRVMAWLTDRFL